MMTLEEVWESLRQDPKIKATMEEAEKSYKLFKKIENLIVADLEAKLAEYQNDGVGDAILNAGKKIKDLQQQLAEKEKYIDELEKCYNELAEREDNTYAQLEHAFGDIMKLKQLQNQTAIAELEKVKEAFNGAFSLSTQQEMFDKYIDQQIKGLKGDNK